MVVVVGAVVGGAVVVGTVVVGTVVAGTVVVGTVVVGMVVVVSSGGGSVSGGGSTGAAVTETCADALVVVVVLRTVVVLVLDDVLDDATGELVTADVVTVVLGSVLARVISAPRTTTFGSDVPSSPLVPNRQYNEPTSPTVSTTTMAARPTRRPRWSCSGGTGGLTTMGAVSSSSDSAPKSAAWRSCRSRSGAAGPLGAP